MSKSIDWKKIGKVAHTTGNVLSFIYLGVLVIRQFVEIDRLLNPKKEEDLKKEQEAAAKKKAGTK